MLLMWKPIRLQGVGAATSIIDGSPHPEGKLDPWRRQVNCLFGLSLNGVASTSTATNPQAGSHPYDPTGSFTCSPSMQFAIDRLPLEAVIGWDATLNGNLAELLQEPTLMGAYEGAAITVLSKGVDFHGGDPYASDTFPTGTTLLTASNCGGTGTNPFPSNFQCNPSSIDGLGVTDSSQGGGGIFVHAWGHNLQIANNRIYNNTGTLSGGISVGQGEFPPGYFMGGATNADPGSCVNTGLQPGYQQPYCHNLNVNVHNNAITSNSSIGDELFSSTLAGVGGVSFCTGADYYKFNYNWVCGNIGTGDGGGIGQVGFAYNGDIEHNTILFNQSTNPTISTNGGGLLIMGTPDVDPTCGQLTDLDCAPPGLSDGTGPGLVINANLLMGNSADSGSGGGIRLQGINGTDIVNFPKTPAQWYTVTVTNNIIANNVAGWDGAGISLQDSLDVNFINNTVISNDTTASAGPLFNTLGAPLAGSPNATYQTTGATTSAPQPAGLVAVNNSAPLQAAFSASQVAPGTGWTCPAGHYSSASANNGNCQLLSYPVIQNDVFWQNRTFYIGVGPLGSGTINQQNVVSLYNSFVNTPASSEPVADATTPNGSGVVITGGTGACVAGTSFWDIGVRGDTGPSDHTGGARLAPSYSILTDVGDYSLTSLHNSGSNPTVVSQYCNGSRTPPEFASMGYQVPAGISDATVPNPVFNLTPAATVDEGNNWVNMAWGPLAMTHPITGKALGNYAPAAGSPVVNYIPSTATANYSAAPALDFFGNPRKTNNAVDAGAVEFQLLPNTPLPSVSPTSLAFGNVATGTTSAAQTLTVTNNGNANTTGITVVVTAPFARLGGTCAAATPLAPAASCTVTVTYSPTATGPSNGTVTITANVVVSGSPVPLTGTGTAPIRTATLTPSPFTYTAKARNCPGTTAAQILACSLDQSQTFTLRNTGNVNLTGITQGVLGGTNASEFSVVRAASTCGPTGTGQLQGLTTLAPNATCIVVVQFKPLTAQTTGVKTATISVADSATAPTQTATMSGTAQ